VPSVSLQSNIKPGQGVYPLELTLGPVLFEWDRKKLLGFYEEAAALAVHTVYIGEVVCAKRGISTADIGAIGRMLEGAGKKVVLSTLALVSNEAEIESVRGIAELPFAVEANDCGVFNIIDARQREVYAGPHIKVYNKGAVEFLKNIGVKRITFPVELPLRTVRENIECAKVEAEVFGHGKLPLAFSWRCYTARAEGLEKSACSLACGLYPEGMNITTLDGAPVFSLNGTSVFSARPTTLAEFIGELKSGGIRAIRISPDGHTKRVVEIYRALLDGTADTVSAMEELKLVYREGFAKGWPAGRFII
jgi:collagenase-like PrtC family protease